MPDEVINREQKFRVIIYHGHLHKISVDDETEEIEEKELIILED